MMKNRTMMNSICTRASRLVAGAALLLVVSISTASAETLMMPDRDTRMGTDTVVWGVTTLADGTAYTLDCGDTAGTQNIAGNVTDRSYITLVCNYPTPGLKTATLTVDAESNTVDIQVFDAAALSVEDDRNLGINMAIEDGLRNLWTTQSGRAANFPASVTTNWGNSFSYADASLIALAFENHGYLLANDGSVPTGLYEKYIVRRGLNYVMTQLSAQALDLTPQGDDPCVGVSDGPAPCNGLRTPGDPGYAVPVAMLPFAASGALARVNTEVAGDTAGMTFGEVLQRLSNTEAWGMTDGVGNINRGGVGYQLNGGQFDGSTAGWAMLGWLDAAAAGMIVPPWVSQEFKWGFDNALNNDGSFDYSADGNPAAPSSISVEKGGIPLQGMFFTGDVTQRASVVTWISDHWNAGPTFCQNFVGCAYTMYNNFKGLKLQGIATLPGVTRPAGPGAIPAGDWHEEYKDWLVANQTSPTSVGGGTWGPTMQFSCCYAGDNIESAIALLILSPVALVLPDPDIFERIGLQPPTQSHAVGQSATVTANAVSTGGTPVPGATVNFEVLTGANAGATGSDVTDANGEATFTYTDTGPVDGGIDTIQATIGALRSNIVEVNWGASDSGPLIPIPATNLWALLLLCAALGMVGVLVLRRD